MESRGFISLTDKAQPALISCVDLPLGPAPPHPNCSKHPPAGSGLGMRGLDQNLWRSLPTQTGLRVPKVCRASILATALGAVMVAPCWWHQWMIRVVHGFSGGFSPSWLLFGLKSSQSGVLGDGIPPSKCVCSCDVCSPALPSTLSHGTSPGHRRPTSTYFFSPAPPVCLHPDISNISSFFLSVSLQPLIIPAWLINHIVPQR